MKEYTTFSPALKGDPKPCSTQNSKKRHMEAALLHRVAALFPAKVSEKDPINTLSSTRPAASAEMERPNSDASGSI